MLCVLPITIPSYMFLNLFKFLKFENHFSPGARLNLSPLFKRTALNNPTMIHWPHQTFKFTHIRESIGIPLVIELFDCLFRFYNNKLTFLTVTFLRSKFWWIKLISFSVLL